VAEILDFGETTVNDMYKLFVKNCSADFYDVHVYVPEGRGRNGSGYCGLC
jgi:hypothetical protein